MLRIANISITEKAAAILRKERLRPGSRAGEHFALVYCSSYTNPDGTTVEGFHPGYTPYGWPIDPHDGWALAELPDGLDFYFLPKFRWKADAWYLVDLRGLIQIEPMPVSASDPQDR